MDTPTPTPIEQKPVTPAETLPPTMEPKRKFFICPWFLVILFISALIVGALLYSDRQAKNSSYLQGTDLTNVPQIDTQASTISGNIESGEPEKPTTTTETAASAATVDENTKTAAFGSTVRIFKGESVWFGDKSNPNPYAAIKLTADDFTDSRCPENAVCIWEGERGVDLTVSGQVTDDTLPVILKLRLKTNASQNAKNHTITLLTVDDEKGGTYAEIKVD